MVNLSITSTIVEALNSLSSSQKFEKYGISSKHSDSNSVETVSKPESNDLGRQEDEIKPEVGSESLLHKEIDMEPDLSMPKVGNPISHHQIIALSTALRSCENQLYCLEDLLRGSKIYMPPPPVEPEKTSEYKTLMARLRRQEEARSYEKMINHQSRTGPPSLNSTNTPAAHPLSNHSPISDTEDEITYADVNRQVTLILNILLSIVACGAAIWIAARWLSTPVRLALSFGGSILVGLAEVVVYSGYLRRIGTAKQNEKSIVEKKEIIETWVVKSNLKNELSIGSADAIDIDSKKFPDESQARRRRKQKDTRS
ncbi:unnamed protein product [Blumeria hordei]|uniref:Uncharacterized protein n=1 Tax=Blumeria hordei TaxID=2867405 RepID=A0A383UIG3_BLUHO|nr:unnamed protein product [Blumeria hordei]